MGGDIQCGGRLIRDQKLRAQRDGHGDDHPLPLTARKLMRIAAHRHFGSRKPNPFQHLPGALARLGFLRHAMFQQGFHHLSANGFDRIKRGHRLLKHHADLRSAQFAKRGIVKPDHFAAVQLDRATANRRLRQQLHECERGHGFARSAFAGQGKNIPRSERKANGVENRQLTNLNG